MFGGFATEPWRVTKHGREAFFGSGESFLFKCLPFEEGQEEQEDGSVEVFEWKYENYFFQWSNVKQIAMGGGGELNTKHLHNTHTHTAHTYTVEGEVEKVDKTHTLYECVF